MEEQAHSGHLKVRTLFWFAMFLLLLLQVEVLHTFDISLFHIAGDKGSLSWVVGVCTCPRHPSMGNPCDNLGLLPLRVTI